MTKLIGCILILFLSLNSSAQEKVMIKDPLALKSKLKKQANETTSIVADFSQEKHVSFMDKPQVSEGKFYYQQADKMRWEQTVPNNYVLLISNGKVRIKDNGKEKNIEGANKMMEKINSLMIGLINGDVFENKAFDTQYFTSGENYIVELIPKNKRLQSIFKTIELTFSKQTVRLKVLTFYESSGDITIMKFFNDKFNQSIKDSIFLNL